MLDIERMDPNGLSEANRCVKRYFKDIAGEIHEAKTEAKPPSEAKPELPRTEKQALEDHIEKMRKENRDLLVLNLQYEWDIERLVEKVCGSGKRGEGSRWERDLKATVDPD